MKRVFDEKLNGLTIAIVETKDGFEGLVQGNGSKGDIVRHADLEVLKTALRNEAGKLHPDYYGMDGAVRRFLSFFENGFSDAYYLFQERNYKDKAREALQAALPIDLALAGDPDKAPGARKALITNLLSQFESARLHEVLGSTEGSLFVKGAAQFAIGDYKVGLEAMEKAVAPYGRISWPIATYLPYFWEPESHLFIKPMATKDFATRVGHSFARDYSADLDVGVYESALDLMAFTRTKIAALQPKDGIDVQSFIWVVGDYTDKDRRAP